MLFILLLIISVVLGYTLNVLLNSINKKPVELPYLFKLNAVIDICFTPKEKQLILNSMDAWDKASHGLIKFDIIEMNATNLLESKEFYTINFVKALKDDNVIKICDELHQCDVVGYAAKNHIFGLVFLVADRATTKKLFTKTCTHEIGHILGLGHSQSKDTIMHKNVHKCCDKPSYEDMKDMIDIWRDVMSAYHNSQHNNSDHNNSDS